MIAETTPTSTATKFVALLGSFVAFPLLGLFLVFAERQRVISLSGRFYVVSFTAVPFIAFLLLSERFDCFAHEHGGPAVDPAPTRVSSLEKALYGFELSLKALSY